MLEREWHVDRHPDRHPPPPPAPSLHQPPQYAEKISDIMDLLHLDDDLGDMFYSNGASGKGAAPGSQPQQEP